MRKKKANLTSEASVEALERAILDLHGCKATWIESVPIKEVFEGETVWQGVVQVFKVDHPKSKLCYAWSHGLDSSKKRRFFVVSIKGLLIQPNRQ